jgi:hypothetical protein
MPMQKSQLAAPPDDGGTSGSFTEPEQNLQAEPGDTRSSEVLGDEPPHEHHTNRGWMMFHVSIALLVVAMLAVAYLKVG